MLRDTVNLQISNYNKIKIHSGIHYIFDEDRNKWISSNRNLYSFSLDNKNITHDRYMNCVGISSINSGYKMIRESVITGLSLQSKLVADCIFKILKNNNEIEIYNLILNNDKSIIKEDLNIDLNIGDYLQVYMVVNSGSISYPILSIETAFRTNLI